MLKCTSASPNPTLPDIAIGTNIILSHLARFYRYEIRLFAIAIEVHSYGVTDVIELKIEVALYQRFIAS